MFRKIFKKRIHEPIALSAIFATSVSLHIAWITNLAVARSETAYSLYSISGSVGPVSGLYLQTFVVFLVVFGLSTFFLAGRDVSHWRERVFWFLVLSIGIFLIMTMPFIFGFEIGTTNV